ncbi:hypothetical protein FF1_035087 [Malus domestica]
MTGTMNQPCITEERMENVHSVKFPTMYIQEKESPGIVTSAQQPPLSHQTNKTIRINQKSTTTSSSVLRGSYDGVPPPATASRLLSAAMRGGHGVNSPVL